MAISMASLRKVKADKPPILLIYGPEKMGKTTLAAEFPAPVFIQTEDGASGALELDTFGLLESYADVRDAMASLMSEAHAFKTVVVDSVSKLQKLVWAEACARNNWTSIEQPGYGKGYIETDYVWNELLDGFRYLRDGLGMTVVLVGHATTHRFDDPETQSYTRYEIDLHQRAQAILTRDVDAILLVKKDVVIKTDGAKPGQGRARADGGDQRWIYCQGRPAFQAGNRFSMPDRLLFNQGKGYETLAPFFPKPAPAEQPAQAA